MTTTSSRTRRTATVVLATAGLSMGAAVLAAAPASAATQLGGVSMQQACNQQYPGMGLTATVTNASSAYSWRCRSPWGYSGQINVNSACANQYGAGAYSNALNPSDPYSWRCFR